MDLKRINERFLKGKKPKKNYKLTLLRFLEVPRHQIKFTL